MLPEDCKFKPVQQDEHVKVETRESRKFIRAFGHRTIVRVHRNKALCIKCHAERPTGSDAQHKVCPKKGFKHDNKTGTRQHNRMSFRSSMTIH